MAFSVDANNILQPLGVSVTGDSRYTLLPATRENTEEVSGVDGEFDFGCDYESRSLELHCVYEVLAGAAQKAAERTITGYLDAQLGVTALTFADEPGKTYYVRYSGSMDFTSHPTWLEFTIPFKTFNRDGNKTDPYIYSSTQNSLTGSGTAVNAGNKATPFTLTITGAVTNPSVTVGGYTMTYTGTINAGSSLVIDTEKLTATLDGVNALANYNGVFPKLAVGNNVVTAAAAGTCVVAWYDRWI